MKPLLLALLLPVLPSARAGILFEDTFDRPDNRNIHAVLAGITDNTGSALVPGGVYINPFLDPNNAAPNYGVQDGVATNGGGQQILANNYQLAVGAGTANVYVNHNFTNAAIPAAGGFSVSLDVLGYSQATNGQGGGFAIGMTQAEADSTRDAFSGVARMTGGFGTAPGAAVPAANVSDFWVVLRGNNSVAWGGKTGTVQAVNGLSSKVGNVSANFRFTNFNAGTTVNYEVLIDGIVRGTGSFTWTHANSNFIGVDVRDAEVVTLDNFRVTTDFVEPLVFPPRANAFEATRLDATTTRFHWKTTEGTLNDPVTVKITNGLGNTVHTSTTLSGFADVTTGSSTDFTLTVSNQAGENFLDTSLHAEDALSNSIRTDAPAAWYRFNEAAGSPIIADSSTNAVPHDGSPVGGLHTGYQGPRDGVGTFDGTGSVLTTFTLDPTTTPVGHTIEAFVRREPNSPVNAAIVSQNDGTPGVGRSHLAVNTDGTIQTFLAGGAAQRKDADVKLAPSNWAHVVMVVDRIAPEIRWYLDGVLIGTSADGTNPDGSTFNPAFTLESALGAWRIGTQKLGNLNFWLGDMDEVVIYDKVLGADRITAHKDAWLASASGLLSATASSETIAPGGSTTITVKAGSDVTSASVSPGGTLTFVNGVATLVVHPAETTTYTITVNGPFGTQTLTVTVTVETAPPTETLPPVITSAAVDGSGFRIKFTGSANTAYRVRGSLDLVAFTIDHGNPTTDGAGLGEVVVPLVSGEKSHFYRVEKNP